jgi:MYXO-CTERM domain-containing protein
MLRTARLAVTLAAALAATAARAQWRTEPMVVWLEADGQDVVAGSFLSPAGRDDLLVLDQARRTARERRHAALLAAQASPFPIAGLALARAFRAGYLAEGGADALADVASHYATGGLVSPPSRIDVVFGSAPGTVRSFDLPVRTDAFGPSQGGPPYVVSFLRLLARTPRADALVMPYCLDDVCSSLFLVDPTAATTAAVLTLAAPDLEPMDVQPEAFPAWVSTVARSAGLDDVAVGSFGTVVLWTHQGAAGALIDLALTDPVVVGTTRHTGPVPGWLPRSVPRFDEVRGVATLDVDQDGLPDLVFTMANPSFAAAGSLVWVKGTGVPADFASPSATPWGDLGAGLGLPDPVTVRPLRGSPASIAVWDRTLQEVVVVAPSQGLLSTWRAPAPGRLATDIRLADVAGSPAPDLLVVMDNGSQPTSVLVYPDLGLPGPEVAWAPGSPGAPARGVPHQVAVVPDPAGASSLLVEWISGAPTTAPVGTGLTHVFPPDCAMPPPPLVVTARATDATGVFCELHAALPLAALEPALALAGATPKARLVLPPGGTTAVVEGTAATGCGAASFGGTPWPAAATVTDASGPTWLRRTVILPEAAYPELLADPAFTVSLATTDPGAAQPVATLALALDATGLVEARQTSDRASVAEGDVVVIRTTLRSRLAVALPAVRVVHALSGLAPAGAPRIAGAAAAEGGSSGAEVVLDALPPGAEVTIDLPVRATGGGTATAVEARSAGGWLVTAPARPGPLAASLPGCGCAAGSGPGGLALALAAAALRRRRRPLPGPASRGEGGPGTGST